MLVKALLEISRLRESPSTLTTHATSLAGLLPLESVRHITRDSEGNPLIEYGKEAVYERIVKELGILPELDARLQREGLQLLICVEGSHDVRFMLQTCSLLPSRHPDLPDLENDPRLAVIPLYGEHLRHWVNSHYLRGKGIAEFHLYDRDSDEKYAESCAKVNERGDGSYACLTHRRSIESYVHAAAISEVFGITVDNATFQAHDYDVLTVIVESLNRTRKTPCGRISRI